MTETGNIADGRNLAGLKLPELRKIASEQGLKGTSGLRKSELIQAITTGQVPVRAAGAQQADDHPRANSTDNHAADDAVSAAGAGEDNGEEPQRQESRAAARRARRNRSRNQHGDDHNAGEHNGHSGTGGHTGHGRDEQAQRDDHGAEAANEDGDRGSHNRNRNNRDRDHHREDGDGGGRRGRRGRRNRNRNRDGQGGRDRDNRDNHNGRDNQGDNQNFDPQELQEVAGIVDIVDNNTAFVRTTGYRQNPADVFVNNKIVRQNGLRSGDAVVGQVRANGQGHSHGNGRNRQRYNQLVRVDSVNGMTPDEAKARKEFHKLTPLYPNKRLRLETEPNILTTRVIDLVMPIGKGQRALIVSPPKAGKTTILQNVANAISTNNPECYLMVVLVDERPEEVTDMQRSVRGEVIASTFDRPPAEHTAVAELAIERAKRLVEMGQDVVVLLDSITRLGRAYNNSSPASGRILSGGVDSNALYPPKRFLGAARNIEEGGSLTIIATAMVETGSAGDTVIFEEFKGTGNAELKLDRKIAERRVFPAVDVNPSGTRKDELLMGPDEARVMHKLRRILSALDPQQSIDMLIKQLKKTKTNGEFLMGVANSAPMAADQTDEDYL